MCETFSHFRLIIISLQIFFSDGLSLSMFEALRGLRDAVAKESGNLGITQNTEQQQEEPDTDELLHS